MDNPIKIPEGYWLLRLVMYVAPSGRIDVQTTEITKLSPQNMITKMSPQNIKKIDPERP